MTFEEARAGLRGYLEDVAALAARVSTIDEQDVTVALLVARKGVSLYARAYAEAGQALHLRLAGLEYPLPEQKR